MRRAAFLVAPAVFLTCLIPFETPLHAQGPSILVASPSGGHPGDLIYLSGRNLDPNRQLYFTMGCPDPFRGGENVKVMSTKLTTDNHGYFTGFPIRAIQLHRLFAQNCLIYAPVGHNEYGVDFPAQFFLAQVGQHLPGQYTKPPLKVKATPSRIESGQLETVTVETWPGAVAYISIQYPSTESRPTLAGIPRPVDLQGFKGIATMRFKIRLAHRLTHPGMARVNVHVVLGHRAFSGAGKFTIVR